MKNTSRWLLPCISALCIALCVMPQPARAGIPVIDWSNIIQSTISAVEDVSQGAQMVLDYKNQLEQYERMLTDAIVPAVYLWDTANQAIDVVSNAQGSLRSGKAALRGELLKFFDLDYYRNSTCYNSAGARGGCFEGLDKLVETLRKRELEAQSQRDKMLDAQEDTFKERAKKSKQLLKNAQGAKGQLEAISYTNQLLDDLNGELRDTRALLVTQQQVAAEGDRRRLAEEAARKALSEKWHKGEFKRSQAGAW